MPHIFSMLHCDVCATSIYCCMFVFLLMYTILKLHKTMSKKRWKRIKYVCPTWFRRLCYLVFLFITLTIHINDINRHRKSRSIRFLIMAKMLYYKRNHCFKQTEHKKTTSNINALYLSMKTRLKKISTLYFIIKMGATLLFRS